MAVQYNSTNGLSGWAIDFFNHITGINKEIPKISNKIKEFFDSFDTNKEMKLLDPEGMQQWAINAGIADKSLIKFLNDTNYATKNLATYQNYLIKIQKEQSTFSKITSNAASVIKSFGALLGSMTVNWAIGEIIGLVAYGLDQLIVTAKEAKEAANSFTNSVRESNEKAVSDTTVISELNERFQELSKGVDKAGHNLILTNEEYKEYKDLIAQISSIMPDLNVRYNENGEKIKIISNNLHDLNKEYNEYRKRTAKGFVSGVGDENGNTVNTVIDNINKNLKGEGLLKSQAWAAFKELFTLGFADTSDEMITPIYGLQKLDELLEKSQKEVASFFASLDDASFAFEDIFGIDQSEIGDMTEEEFEDFRNQMRNQIAIYQNEINTMYDQLRISLQQFALSDDTYWKLDESSREYISNFLMNMSNDMLESANMLDENGYFVKHKITGFISEMIDSFSNKEIQNAYKNLIEFDTENADVPVSKLMESLKENIKTIQEGTGNRFNEEDLLSLFGLSDINEDMGSLLQSVQNKLQDAFESNAQNLSYEDLKIAAGLKVEDDVLLSWNELIAKIKKTKELRKKNEKKLTFNEILFGSIGTETIDDYTQKISTLQSYLDKLKDGSYSSTDLLTLSKNFGITGDSIENIIKNIESLMDFEAETIIAKIDEILNTKNLNEITRNELERLKQVLEDISKEAQNTASFPLTGNVLADVQKLTEGLDQLDKIYADVYDKKEFDWSSILNNDTFSKTFGEYTEEYNNFLDTISKSPDDIATCQNAFNRLTGAYIYGTGVLNEITESTKDTTIQMLEQMGIANAQEIVMKALSAQEAFLTAKKKDSSIQSENLAEATWKEIQAILVEGEAAVETQTYLAQLALSKFDITNTPINTDDDVRGIIAIANAAGTSKGYVVALQTALENLVKAQESVKKIQNSEVNGSFADGAKGAAISGTKVLEASAKETAEKYLADIEKHIYNNKLNPEQFLADYKGGTATKEIADKGQEKSEQTSEKSKAKKQIDFFEYRLKELDNAIDTVESHMNNFTGSSSKNLAIDTMIHINTRKQSDLQKSLALYTHMAEAELANIPADLQDMAKDGAINITDFIETADDENGTIAESIENYRRWAEKIDETSGSIEDLNTTLRQLELDKFKNMADDYTQLLEQITRSTDRINTLMDTQEKTDGVVSKKFYEELITQFRIQMEYLQKEKAALEQQMQHAAANGITAGSTEWAEMTSTLADIDTQLIQCTGSMEDFADSIREIDVSNFKKVMDGFGDIEDEIDLLLSLSEEEPIVNEQGQYTQSAITQLGLLADKYVLAKRKEKEYQEAISSLDDAYGKGKLNFTEYLELHRDLNDGLSQSIQLQKSVQDSVMDYHKKTIDQEIENLNKARDAYKDYIDMKKAALDQESDNHDFQKELSSLQKELSSLDHQINQLTGEDDYTLALKAELQQERKDKQEELDEMLYNHSIESQKEALDKQYEDYSENCDNTITKLEESLEGGSDTIKQIFTDTMEFVSSQSGQYLEGLNNLCSEYGLTASAILTEPWQNGENALGIYNGALTFQTGSFNLMLDNVKQHIYNDGLEADLTAQKLMNTFNVSAEFLKSELGYIWSGLNNDTWRAEDLQNQLSYLFTSISSEPLITQISNANLAAGSFLNTTSQLNDTVGNIGNSFSHVSQNATNALENITNSSLNSLTTVEQATNSMLNSTSNSIKNAINATSTISGMLKNNYIAAGLASLANGGLSGNCGGPGGGAKFAKGGVITSRHGYLKPLARAVGEDTMVAARYGERILTPKQNEAFEKFMESVPDIVAAHLDIPGFHSDNPYPSFPSDSRPVDNSITLNAPLVEVNGSIHHEDMKHIEKMVDKKLNHLQHKQNVALRTYMGIK